ncbi:MAG: hypothetical protein JHC25_02355 [Thermodesulfobacterium sp.]|jgi:hypothetical protein|nr:hypothetical protein [Thermodesulfobacterium sp.]
MRINSLVLPSLPPLRGGEVVKVKGKGVYLLLLKPLEILPGVYASVPFVNTTEGDIATLPLEVYLDEELIEEVVARVPSDYLEKVQGSQRYFVDDDWRVITPVLWEIQGMSAEYFKEMLCPISCKKATIIISERCDFNLFKFSRFGRVSARKLPNGRLEVILQEGTFYFYGKRIRVEVVQGSKRRITERGRFALCVEEGKDLPEMRVVL